MKQTPVATVSIVVPVYNRAHTIVRCLDSIATQRGIDRCRLIVVDNNSTDNSAQTVCDWAATNSHIALTLLHEPRQGAAIARNTGLAAADTVWTLFFDSDDIMLQGHVERLLTAIDHRPGVELFGWDITSELPGGRLYKPTFTAGRPLVEHMRSTTVGTLRIAARTELFRRVGAWDESLRGWDDFELGVRLLLADPVIVKLDDPDGTPLVKTFFTEQSLTGRDYSSKAAEWESALDAIERQLSERRPSMLRWVAYRRARLAGLYAREGASQDARRLLKQSRAQGFGPAKAAIIYSVSRFIGRGAPFAARLIL